VINAILIQVSKWEQGGRAQEWTCRRLKALKVDFVRALAGKEPVGDYAKKTVRINGSLIRIPKGIFGQLFRLGLTAGKRRRPLHQVWQALIIYTRYSSGKVVTHNQWKKFSVAVRSAPPSVSELREARRYVSLGLGTLPEPAAYRGKPKPLITFQPREGKTVPRGRLAVKESEFLHTIDWYVTQNFHDLDVERRLLAPVLQGTPWLSKLPGIQRVEGLRRLKRRFTNLDKRQGPLSTVGIIGFIPEPGFKLRAVANPSRLYQQALDPLGSYVFRWLRRVQEDCCYHQETGVYAVQKNPWGA